ncbi:MULTISPECIES: recombinase family protein [Thalassospira]|uniref:Resolvase/invertase-type recombinase catalytic domain-containing protein n=1 Tax=Thalassospira profundimaris TaxID=502049 RepID=A0A367VJF6_9PROT|nr:MULTISPECIES: recombinase family protein [Thalassospira]KZB71042.1 hypothetical protein AUQ43_09415 [Thalassospira sp. MCCC 1A01148]RCK25313.1 hypothetical protein TH6_01420 [Thalassospira profundimaris]
MTESQNFAIGYARVSTTEQNLDLQVNALKKFGVEERFLFTDHASGAGIAFKRKGLLRAVKALRAGDTFVVWKLDRLGRSLAELIKTVEVIEKKGAQLVVLQDHIDTTTAVGKMFFHLIGMFAEFERNLISERTKAGLEAARQRGTYATKPAISQATMQEAAILYRKGLNWVQIAKKVGVSKSSIYNYRSQIEALMTTDIDEE